MASRSFKPGSYLHSPSKSSMKKGSRPAFMRTTSSSSTQSTRSHNDDDDTLTDLTALQLTDDEVGSAKLKVPAVPHKGAEEPGRKKSAPIAIQLPTRKPAVYTPLSARGDLPGGYFPNHETIQRSYTSNPFSKVKSTTPPPLSPSAMSYASSPMDRASTGFSPVYTASPLFEHMAIPKGKYHPSNFVSPSTSPGPSLRIPSHKHSLPARKQSPRPERHSPDAKRKLQQYQRDMIAQARLASLPGTPLGVVSKPESPRLTPMGSPGPITPFELEENAGYLVAGTKSRGASEREVVARLIEAEGERARMVGREVPRSPVLSV